MSIREFVTFGLHWLAQHHRRLLSAATLANGAVTGMLWWASVCAARAHHLIVAVLLIGAAAGAIAWGQGARRSLQTDPLTGLPTRAAYTTILASGRRRTARRRGSELTVGLVDADGLHQINHAFGHAGGDQYLTTLARRLRTVLPNRCLLLRLGGDEFAVLAPGVGDRALVAAISTAVGGQTVIAGHQVALRASAGVATVRTDPGWGLALADAALARAKAAGGNQVVVFDAARDGVPDTDGTRPRLRRREAHAARTRAVWDRLPGGPTLMLAVSDSEARALLTALRDYLDHHRAPVAGRRPDRLDAGPADTGRPVEVAEVAGLAERVAGLLHPDSLTPPRTGGEGRGPVGH